MDDCLDSLGGAYWFSTLDCNTGYWQLRVNPSDKAKTASTTHLGMYKFRRMPFGLTNAPATFQCALDVILSGVKWQSCLVYLDDVIVFSPTAKQRLLDLDVVLGLLSRSNVFLKQKKCQFFSREVKYLGHIVSGDGVRVDTETTAVLQAANPPRTRTQVRSFLGLANVYRRFVPDFSRL
jgi:Reverse transcriptase (RNA-dependent DNA polymerase)